MTSEDDLGRLLADAFDAQARAAVGDHAAPPPPRFADPGAVEAATTIPPARRSRSRLWAPVAAAAAVVAIVAGVVVAADRGHDTAPPPAAAGTSTAGPARSATATGVTVAPADAVRVTTLNADGVTYGVGMPVIAYFSKPITDARAFQAATKVTADGKPLDAAWYFQRSSAGRGPVEGHLRPQSYWPAHSKIHVEFPAAGTTLGGSLAVEGGVRTLDFTIGARTILTVDDATHTLRVETDNRDLGTFPVSLGSTSTPTTRGVKVIMEKGRSICMSGPGYKECGVKDTQRLTYTGEYLHAAPWNTKNIARGVNSSNGCTNLDPSDAGKLFEQTRIGDVVTYPNADGPQMTLGNGYGDWNVSWDQWLTGGLVPTR